MRPSYPETSSFIVTASSDHTRLLAALLVTSTVLAGCSAQSERTQDARVTGDRYDSKYGVSSSERVVQGGPVPKGGGTYKLGKPYSIAGRWYVPREEPGYDRSGTGSWYGDEFHGRKTANGEIFDRHALTAAHPTLPLPSYAYVTNLDNGRTILVRINDRGPYAHDRVIDLSHASATALGYSTRGLAHVRVRYAGRAPLDGNDRHERAFLASQPWWRGWGSEVAAEQPAQRPMRQMAQPAATPVGRSPVQQAPAPQTSAASPSGGWTFNGYRSSIASGRQGLGAAQ